jgi:hypothetical protein
LVVYEELERGIEREREREREREEEEVLLQQNIQAHSMIKASGIFGCKLAQLICQTSNACLFKAGWSRD